MWSFDAEPLLRGCRRFAAAWLVLTLAGAFSPAAAGAVRHKLLVVSVDGLDRRYLRDADTMSLAIPNLRRIMREGETADGVVGVWPTITWPSHTSIVTGVRPDQHGVLSNAERGTAFDQSYWSAKVLKAEPLWRCASRAGLTTATITWPVTLEAGVTYNLPEVAKRRNGGSMDYDSVAANASPGLVQGVTRMFPSFPQQWVDDRTRTQAGLYLLKAKEPDLILLHLVDLDSEEHDQGPFGVNAKAILERSDELIGNLQAALPPDYDLVITSDHGFERLDHIANLRVELAQAGVAGTLKPMGGLVTTDDPAVASWLRSQSGKPGGDVGREVPRAELEQYAPGQANVLAAFEPADHVMFGQTDSGPARTPPREKGEHGFWPLRHDYRSVYVVWGPGVRPGRLPELQMIDLKDRLAGLLGIQCPTG